MTQRRIEVAAEPSVVWPALVSAAARLGKVEEQSRDSRFLILKMRYGLNPVRMRVSLLSAEDGRSCVLEIQGRGQDIGGVASRKTIDRLCLEVQAAMPRRQSSPTPSALGDSRVQQASRVSGPHQEPSSGISSVADEVAKFGALRDAGLITDEEFQLQKSRLLGTPPGQQMPPTTPMFGPSSPFRGNGGVDTFGTGSVSNSSDLQGANTDVAPPFQAPHPGTGWRPDPLGLHQYRFWDGRAWTDEVRDPAPPNQPTRLQPSATGAMPRSSDPASPATLDDATPVVQPGWYPDPYGAFEHRFWDGARWTEHVASDGQGSVSPPPR